MTTIREVHVAPLSVPLVDPFVIATGRIDVTRAALVTVSMRAAGEDVTGLGESAALPPVTHEDQPEVLAAIEAARESLRGATIDLDFPLDQALGAILDAPFADAPVARSGVETAILDALARTRNVPLRTLLDAELGAATRTLVTDVTIPMHDVAYMAQLARQWRAMGFRVFKIKVGKDVDADARAVEAIHRAATDATLRLDANAGFTADEALRVFRAVASLGVGIECFEQPCARDDLEGMARVAREIDPPVVADESVRTLDDLQRVIRARAADGVNLKLAKSGGPLAALAIGRRARAAGMSIMIGGMIETRLGMTAAAHVACALGGADFVDLDTAWLLASDPFEGGYRAAGPTYDLPEAPGLGVVFANTSSAKSQDSAKIRP